MHEQQSVSQSDGVVVCLSECLNEDHLVEVTLEVSEKNSKTIQGTSSQPAHMTL